jgi:hypothetical protein
MRSSAVATRFGAGNPASERQRALTEAPPSVQAIWGKCESIFTNAQP